MSTSAALPDVTGHDDADLLIGDVARLSGLSIDTCATTTGPACSAVIDWKIALGYLLALDPSIIPLPEIRNERQARENASVLAVGPSPEAETAEITALLDSSERR